MWALLLLACASAFALAPGQHLDNSSVELGLYLDYSQKVFFNQSSAGVCMRGQCPAVVMLRYLCLCWAFVFFVVGVHCGCHEYDDCTFSFRAGEVQVTFTEGFSGLASGTKCFMCSIGSFATFNSYTLIAYLAKENRKCPAKKTVVFSFTSPILGLGERQTGTFSTTPDCAVNMSHPIDDSCRQLPLLGCVDVWEFIYVFDIGSVPSKGQTVKFPPFITVTINTTIDYNCTCGAIRKLLSLRDYFEDPEVINQIYALCIIGNKDLMKQCGALQLLERAIRSITNQGRQAQILSLTTVSVTEISNDPQDSFIIALPSQTQPGPQPALGNFTLPGSNQLQLDDVTVEVQPEVLSQVASRSGGKKLNVGTFWFFENSLFSVEQDNVSLLNSRVVALDLGRNVSNLQTPVQLTFYQQNLTQNASSTHQCVFWDVENEAKAKWSSYGCKTVVAEGKITCFCNHLSFFAVLLTPTVNPLSSRDVYILTLMSRVGCSVSLGFLVLTLLTHAFYKKGPSEHSLWIHLHVCLSLLLLNLSFLINDLLTALGVPAVCVAMAALTHYALLSVLTWFTVEGLHLYLLFIRVFNIHIRKYLLKLALLGWGLPMVPVGVGVGLGVYGQTKIEHTEGGSTALCYMKQEHQILQILTYGFFVLVLLFNITMFSVVLHRVLKARLNSPLPQDRGLNMGMVLSLLALSWMLGISWGVMALSSIGPLQVFTFYIFCTINGLHGFFLFLRYCTLLRKEKEATKSTVISTVSFPRSSNTN